MIIKRLFSKPKWQHKDPEIRAAAVANSQDPALIEQLIEIVNNDQNEAVRLQACKRINDFNILKNIASNDDNHNVKQLATQRLQKILAGAGNNQDLSTSELTALIQQLDKTKDAPTLIYIAINSLHSELRELAITLLNQPKFTIERILNDDNKKLKYNLIKQIENIESLKKIRDNYKKTDKSIFNTVNKKIQHILLEQEDEETINHHAKELCGQIEKLITQSSQTDKLKQQFEQILSQWQKISDKANEKLVNRFNGSKKIIEISLGIIKTPKVTPTPQIQIEPETIKEPMVISEINRLESSANDEKLNAFAAKLKKTTSAISEVKLKSLQQEWQQLNVLNQDFFSHNKKTLDTINQLLSNLEQKQFERKKLANEIIEQIQSTVDSIYQTIDNNQLKKITPQLETLQSLQNSYPYKTLPRETQQQIKAINNKIKELRDWQHWSNNNVRKALCEQAEKLIAEKLHPDALTTRVNELKKQWHGLELAEEALDAQGRHWGEGIKKRFLTAIHKAYKPTQDFYQARDDIRHEKASKIEEIIQTLQQIDSQEKIEHWPMVNRSLSTARKALSNLHEVPPNKRKQYAQQLKNYLSSLSAKAKDNQQLIARVKNALIIKAEALSKERELTTAVNKAKELMQQWKQAGRTFAKEEKLLWEKFQQNLDVIYKQLDVEKQEEQQARNAATETLKEIYNELDNRYQTFKKDKTNSLTLADINRAQTQWEQIGGNPPRELMHQFNQLCKNAQQEIKQHLAQQRVVNLQLTAKLAKQCDDIDKLLFNQTSTGDAKLLKKINKVSLDCEKNNYANIILTNRIKRFNTIELDEYLNEAKNNGAIALNLCIELEIAAEIESPKTYQQDRMDFQVNQLAKKLQQGRNMLSQSQYIENLLNSWHQLGPIEPALRTKCNTRINKAKEKLYAILDNALY